MRGARQFVAGRLTEWGLDAATFTASLLVSELVTNVVLHARTEVHVEVEVRDGVVRVAVVDASPRPVQRRRHSVESGTGRGLMLLEQMAGHWGVEPRPPGKAVWFELSARDDDNGDNGGGNGDVVPDLDSFLSLDDDLGGTA